MNHKLDSEPPEIHIHFEYWQFEEVCECPESCDTFNLKKKLTLCFLKESYFRYFLSFNEESTKVVTYKDNFMHLKGKYISTISEFVENVFRLSIYGLDISPTKTINWL